MTTSQFRLGFWSILLAGLAVRLSSMPPFPFCCDVPTQVQVIQARTFLIQFPGYAPFHLLIAAIAASGIPVFTAMWLFSLTCTTLASIYVTFAARRAAGDEFALLAALVVSFAIFPIYFAMAGASYPTDMLAAAGLIFHGWEFLRTGRRSQYYLALVWLCFGLLMRPISMSFCVLSVAYLLYRKPGWRAFLITAAALALTVIAYLGISVPFFGSLHAMFHDRSDVTVEISTFEWTRVGSNVFRAAAYPVYGFHVWLIFGGFLAVSYWRSKRTPMLIYLALASIPYLLLLTRYIAHAGYYCLLLPAIVLLPCCFISVGKSFSRAAVIGVAGCFLVISAFQWFLSSPVTVTGLPSGIADAYFLQYSRTALKSGTFENLASIMYKHHLDVDSIPPLRRKELEP